jgi:type VI protein secretion system component Hcp
MKTTLVGLFVTLGIASIPGFAQSRTTVTFSHGAACSGTPFGPPAFNALAVAMKSTSLSTTGAGAGAGRLTFDDITITRDVDDCSVSLYGLQFQEQHIKSVTISLQNLVNGVYKEALRISLTDALITSMSDAESGNAAPIERVTLTFSMITILDPATGNSTMYRR